MENNKIVDFRNDNLIPLSDATFSEQIKILENNGALFEDVENGYIEKELDYIENLISYIVDSIESYSIDFYINNKITLNNGLKFLQGLLDMSYHYNVFHKLEDIKKIKKGIEYHNKNMMLEYETILNEILEIFMCYIDSVTTVDYDDLYCYFSDNYILNMLDNDYELYYYDFNYKLISIE